MSSRVTPLSILRSSWLGRSNAACAIADHAGMGDPGAVMAVARLAFLVGADLGEGGVVRRLVALDRNLRRHAAHREGAAAVAGLDQLQRISGEEGLIHRHRGAIGSQAVRRSGRAA